MDPLTNPAADPGGFGADAFEEGPPDVMLLVHSGLTLLAGLLLLFGLVRPYARRTEEIDFVVAFSGTIMAVGGFWTNTFVAPSLAHALTREASFLVDATPRGLPAGFTLSYGLVAAGRFVFGLAALRDGFCPHAATAALMVGAALT